MTRDYLVKRYSAYYLGWCQAFGEHEADLDGDSDLRWLHAEERVGIILSAELRKRFYRLVLGHQGAVPEVLVSPTSIVVGEYVHALAPGAARAGMQSLIDFLRDAVEIHMFLSYHLFYPSGTRILTFARRRPLGLLYREIASLRLSVLEEASDSDEAAIAQ